MAWFQAMPAQADVAANVTLATTNIFRGESTSGDDGAASLELNSDLPGGFFAGGAITVTAGEHRPTINNTVTYVGYAIKHAGSSLELGVVHRRYRAQALFDEAYSPDYIEAFAGITRRNAMLRLYVSPNYLRDGRNSYYAELNGRVVKTGPWSLIAHGGLSVLPSDPGQRGEHFYYDASVQATRPLGRLNLTFGAAHTQYPVFGPAQPPRILAIRPRVFASLSQAF